MKKIIHILAILLTTSHLIAQTFSSIPLAKLETLHSDIVGTDFKLQITLPFDFNPQEKKYPILYYLDAYTYSGGMNELAKVEMIKNNFEQFVMVGISYEANPLVYPKLRERDYIPPINEMDTIHRGDKFLAFIKTELIPYMESNYGIDSNDRGLLGYSLSGLFTTWVLKKEPNLFNRLAIISPSLWYGKDEFILDNAEFLTNVKNAQNLKVFIAYGSLERDGLIALSTKLYESLKTNNNIEVTKVIFEGETHSSVWYAATTRALYTLYEEPFKALVKKAMDYYHAKKFNEALDNFELVFEKYPNKVNERNKYNIACIYALKGDSDNAFKYLQMLVDSKVDRYEHTLNDSDLNSLHNDIRWIPLINALKKGDKK